MMAFLALNNTEKSRDLEVFNSPARLPSKFKIPLEE